MATLPTKLQVKARDGLSDALFLIAEAARVDPKSGFDARALEDVATRVARACTAFPRDEIVAKSLERRGREMGLPSALAELLTLVETSVSPFEMMLASDDAFRKIVVDLEQEIGSD